MAENLPPQPLSDTPQPWPSSLDFALLQQAISGDPGPLTYPDPPTVYSTSQTNPNSDYTFYKIQYVFADDSGMDVLRTGNADQTTRSYHTAVQMHQPYTELRVLWTAQRWGDKPTIPSKDLSNPNCIYIRGVRSQMNSLQFPNGLLHRVSGIYFYKLLAAMSEADTYPTAVTPAETASATDVLRMYDPTYLSKDIINLSGAIPASATFPSIIVESAPAAPTAPPAPIYIPPR